jgi:hypothetical protein
MNVIDLFHTFATQPDAQAAFAYAMANPMLIWPERWPEIESWIAARPTAEQPALAGRLNALQNLGRGLAQQPAGFPEEQGPVELLAARVEAYEIGLDHALARAAAPEVAEALAPLYVRVCAARAHRRALDDDWRAAVLRFRILLAALDAWQAVRADDDPRADVVARWLEVTSVACHDVPDGHLFRDAAGRGRATAEAAEAAGDTAVASELHHRLGVLHLDTYITSRTNVNFEGQIQRWRARLIEEYGLEAAYDETRHMPEPAEALTEAVHQFERALTMRPGGEERGLTLKALAEALYWREIAGGPAEREHAIAAAKEALTLLDPHRHAHHTATLHELLQALAPPEQGDETPGEAGADADLLWLEPEELARHTMRSVVIDRYLRAANLVMTTEPARALALLRRVAPLIAATGNDEQRVSSANRLVNVLMLRFDAEAALEAAGGDVTQAVANLETRSEAEHWVPVQLAAGLLALAGAATAADKEEGAIPLVGRALDVFAASGSDLAETSRVVRVALMVGAAVNAFRAGEIGAATERYVNALMLSLDARLPQFAVDLIARAEDTALRGDHHVYAPFLVGLAEYGPRLAAEMGPGVANQLQQAWHGLLGHIQRRPQVLLEPLWLALQAAKGGAFAAMLQHGVAYDWRRDPDATRLLARRTEVQPTVSDSHVTAAEAILDEDLLLAAYAAELQPSGGGTPREVLTNLEQRFDSHLARALVGEGSPLEALLTLQETQQLLDARTVLLSQHVGRTDDGKLAYTGLLVTRETVHAARGVAELPSATFLLGEEGQAVATNWLGPLVAGLRTHLLEEPGPAEVVPEAAEDLATHLGMFLGGGLVDRLAELRAAGKDHLCIHGHGPLHFYPQHLLGPEGRPLADDWIVTAIPHPAMLRRLGEPLEAGDRLPIAGLGLGFADGQPHSLPPLRGATEEACTAAAALGGRAWVDSEATEARFVEALTGAVRVHLSTHGRHRVAAPAFQCIYLSPDHVTDGIFHAYEVLGLDLRYLDMLTLSACETALGRMDIGDSPRGLPASLFIAGARTVLGCLWPVATDVAASFFGAFYAALAGGAPKLDAFRTAQRITRDAFPAYRDWGAFHYAGLW